MQEKLTDAVVARLKPPAAGKLDVWDKTTRSFGVRLFASGQRSWVVGLRKSGAAHGVYALKPPGMKLKEARAKAQKALDDPAAFFAERGQAAAKKERTFGVLAQEFLDHGRTKTGRLWRPATKREHTRALISYGKGLHALPVADVKRRDAAELIRDVAKLGETAARCTRAAGMRFYGWLNENGEFGEVEYNPFARTSTYATNMGARVLTDDEIKALWAETAGPGDFNLIVRLWLWTGCRRTEAAAMRWSELKDDVWTVPGTRTKNHRPLVLPLSRQALAALKAHRQIVGRDFVFGIGPNGFNGISKCLERLRERLKFAQKWGPHDCRRTVQTRMRGLGLDREVVNRVLNHAMTKLDETYDRHEYADEKRVALQRWADDLDRLITPAHEQAGNVVVQMARKTG